MAMTDAGQDMARDANAFAAALFSAPMLDVVVRTTESYGKACLAWHEEILRFASERLQRDSELGQALANTRNWADAAKLHQEWATSALRDYTNETTRLFEIAADAGSKMAQNSSEAGAKMAQSSAQAASDAGQSAAYAARSAADATADLGEAVRAESSRQRAQRRTSPGE